MAIMVAIMVLVLSVFIGFETAIHDALQKSGDHLSVNKNGRPFASYHKIIQASKEDAQLQAILKESYPRISINVLFEKYREFHAKALRGIPYVRGEAIANNSGKDEEMLLMDSMRYFPKLIHYNKKHIANFDRGNYVLVGREMARFYNLYLGQKIDLLLPQGGILDRRIDIQQRSFIIAGFYQTGFYEFDSNLVFTSLKTAQRALNMRKKISEIIFQIHYLDDIKEAQNLLAEILPFPGYRYTITSIWERRGNFFAAMQLERTLMMIILSLLIIAGSAGIWITVRLLVKSKFHSIGILRSMGISSSSLMFIFILHSIFIGLLSTLVGGTIGIYLANNLDRIIVMIEDFINGTCQILSNSCQSIQLIPANIYYFDHIPVSIDLGIVFGIGVITLILSGLAGYQPAKEASRIDPIQSINHD